MRKKRYWLPVLLASLLMVLGSTQVTFFVVQPIGAIPEGRTLVILGRQRTRFIDSADAICEREMGGVSLLCRVGVLSAIAGENGDGILMRLPYSEPLYLISTDGKTYGR